MAEGVLFGLLAIASTWPLAARFDTALALGTEPTATVPMLNLWTIGWNVNRLQHGYQDYWDAPIYYPARDTLALSEPLPLAGWLAWPIWSNPFGPIAVYNALLWLFLTLNGWCSCRFLRRLRLAPLAAVAGGAIMCLLPIVHWQLGVLQLVSLWAVVWTVAALRKTGLRRRVRDGVHVGVAFACTYLLCNYVGLMLSMILLCSTPFWFGRRWRDRRWWLSCGTAVLTVILLLGPVVHRQLEVARRQGIEFSEQTIARLSVVPADFWTTPGPQWIPLPSLPRGEDALVWPLSPGTLKSIAALCGCICGLRLARYRRWTWFLLAVLATSVVLAMGPRLSWNGYGPYHVLAAWYPGFAHVRNVFRFAYFVQLAIALLAALGLHGIAVAARRCSSRFGHRWATVWLLVAGFALAAEAWPSEPRLATWNKCLEDTTWVEWLARAEQADVRLICFPLAGGRSSKAHAQTATWMVCQLWHWRPMVNGYSASIPAEYLLLEEKLKAFPEPTTIESLRDAGVTHCLFDSREYPNCGGNGPDPSELVALGFTLECDDRQQDVQIWRLPQRP